jgi:prepilin-type N-terminal cleavage/methylation domain-containing protein
MLKKAFTLIELLVVIAIIAILAAILFPVFSRAKDAAYRNGDIANMNSIRTALQLYRADHGAYPPALLGYVTTYTPGGTDIIPANLLKGFLYPRRLDALSILKPAYNRFGNADVTTAVYPNQDPRALGTAPVADLDGDGRVTGADDIAGARQAFGPADGLVCPDGTAGCAANVAQRWYSISGYDVASIPLQGGGTRTELRYALFWTDFSLNGGGNAQDDPRQLGYSDPPETTVITWNAHFRDYPSGSALPNATNRDIALFLGGAARPFDSRAVYERSWRTTP